jgi:hypothetical protein
MHTVGGAKIGRPPPRPPHYQELLFEDEILREHGPDPTTSPNSDQTRQQAQDRPEPVFHFNHFALEHKQSKQRLIRFSGCCNCEFAICRRVLEANSSSLRRFTLGHLLAVKLVGEHALFKEELELPQTSRDLLFGELGFAHHRAG